VTNRPEGSYSARFRATDGSGNVRIVERTFSIDATPAVTRIDSGPPDGSSSADTSVTFTFSANESGATFKCRVFPAALTPGAFGPCSGTGSHTASGFAPGAYTFEVLATDPFGNTDPTSEKRTFSVTAASGGGGGGAGPGSPGVVAGRRIDARVQTFFIRFGRLTRVGRLTVIAAPRGAKVTVTCKSARHVCAFKRVVLRFNGRSLALAKRFKRRKLRARTVITIAVSKEGFVAKTFRYTLRPARFPAVRIS
jgi:hypothetical protein